MDVKGAKGCRVPKRTQGVRKGTKTRLRIIKSILFLYIKLVIASTKSIHQIRLKPNLLIAKQNSHFFSMLLNDRTFQQKY